MPKDGRKVAVGAGLVAIGVGAFLLLKKPALAAEDIVISDLLIEPSEVYVGEPVTISLVATNVGETAGSYEVNCEIE